MSIKVLYETTDGAHFVKFTNACRHQRIINFLSSYDREFIAVGESTVRADCLANWILKNKATVSALIEESDSELAALRHVADQ